MLLDHAQEKLVLAWLSTHAPNRRCSLCGGGEFVIKSELMVALPLGYLPKADQPWDASRAYPMVVVTCKKCANMRFFSAITIGILPAG